MLGKAAIGVQSFEDIRTRNIFYVDKTNFIKEWWEKEDSVTLITRPRRFGKTLNLSMIECFFSNKYADRGELFEGLSIWGETCFRALQGTYPVIFLSFAKVKAAAYEDMKYSISKTISDIYEQNRFLLENNILSDNEKKYFENIQPEMSASAAAESINALSNFLSRYHGKKVRILTTTKKLWKIRRKAPFQLNRPWHCT